MSTKLTIPGDILQAAGLTERECLIELAVHLYAERRLAIGQAMRLSALTRSEFEATILAVETARAATRESGNSPSRALHQ